MSEKSEIPPYVFEPEHEVVRDFAEFSGLSIEELSRLIDDFRRLSAEEWRAHPGAGWGEKAATFYGASETYVYDLLRANPSRSFVLEKLGRFEPRLVEALREHPGRRLLEFGGGTGVFCQIAVEMGKSVTYLDLPGRASEFAAWRFRKLCLDVDVVLVRPGDLELHGEWDVIFSDAVFEHLVDPVGTARTLARHLAPGGFLGLLIDLEGDNPELPMHRPVDLAAVQGALAAEGLSPRFGLGSFVSGWDRPARPGA